jgi:hypothetical protein
MNLTNTESLAHAAAASVRSSMRAAPAFMVAIALAAGMAASDAKAWGESESVGRTIGTELGRAAVGGYGAQATVGGLLGGVVGAMIGRPIDKSGEATQREEEVTRAAKEQAQRDAAYQAERKRLDPNYSQLASSSDASNSLYSAISSNAQRASANVDAILADYERRNRPRQ